MAVADLADRLVGTRFVPGGRDPSVGLDCYGVLVHVLQSFGWNPPDPYAVQSRAQFRAFADACWAGAEASWAEVASPATGDALVMRSRSHPEGHVAVFLDAQHVLDATPSAGVTCVPFARVRDRVVRVMRLADHRRGA